MHPSPGRLLLLSGRVSQVAESALPKSDMSLREQFAGTFSTRLCHPGSSWHDLSSPALESNDYGQFLSENDL